MRARRFFIVLCVVPLLLVTGGAAFLLWALSPADAEDGRAVRLEVPAGSSARFVARKLEEAGLVRDGAAFYLLARIGFIPHDFKAGTYELSPSQSAGGIARALSEGRQAYVVVSFPEGLTLSKMARIVEESGLCPADDFIAAARDPAIIASRAVPASTLEGYLFPDTYYLTPGMSAEEIVRLLLDNFYAKLDALGVSPQTEPRSLHESIILASVVEREYRAEEEASIIASVFANRLRDGIGLYSCATIEYIITEIQGRPHPDVIRYSDLEIDSPYNTYKWAGLPAGAISNPGLVALSAVLNPVRTDYYFFRLTDPQSGTHTFSKTFDAHVAAESLRTKKAAGR